MRTLAIIVIGLLAGSGSTAAQSSSGDALPVAFMGSVSVAPPEGEGAWMLQVISRGGLTGRGTGDLVIVSNGIVKQMNGGHLERMAPGELRTLAQRIRGTDRSRWTIGSRLGSCNDCFATLIVLTLREPDGIHTYAAFWDATTRGRIPADVLQIHDLAVGGREVAFGRR
jgi:hypothetical protein